VCPPKCFSVIGGDSKNAVAVLRPQGGESPRRGSEATEGGSNPSKRATMQQWCQATM